MYVFCVIFTLFRFVFGFCRISVVFFMEKLLEGGGLDKLLGSGVLYLFVLSF